MLTLIGRLNLNTHTLLTQRSRSGLTMPLCRHSVGTCHELSSSGNTRPQSSQLAEPLWTDPGRKSGISMRDLISTLKKEKEEEAQSVNELSNILQKSSHARKSHHHHQVCRVSTLRALISTLPRLRLCHSWLRHNLKIKTDRSLRDL